MCTVLSFLRFRCDFLQFDVQKIMNDIDRVEEIEPSDVNESSVEDGESGDV